MTEDIVTGEFDFAARHIGPSAEERRAALRQIEVHEYELFPDIHAERNQAILFPIEVLDAFKVGHAFERTIQPVGPAVIGTLQSC